MDYEQSIKNFNRLKNFARGWDECKIFLFFYSETEFEIEIYDLDCTDAQKEKIDENLYGVWPYAFIKNEKCSAETLYYKDQNLTLIYDLFTETIIDIDFKDPVDEKALQKEFLQLIKILENK